MIELLTGIGEYGGTIEMGRQLFSGLFVLSLLLYWFFAFKKKSLMGLKKSFVVAMLIFYLLSVIRLVFFPIDIWPAAKQRENFAMMLLNRDYPWTLWEIMSIDFVPFRTIYYTLPRSNDWVSLYFAARGTFGNLILLFPFAVFIGLFKKEQLSYKKALLQGLLISLFIESGQLLINLATQWPNRLVTFDDLMLNSLGFLLGYATIKKFKKMFPRLTAL